MIHVLNFDISCRTRTLNLDIILRDWSCIREHIITQFTMDELKIEPESHNDNELKSPTSADANERISVVIPAVKCSAEVSQVVTVGCVNGLICVCVHTHIFITI
jgi:hypothetical protein